jgi:hypothetical protein
VTSAGKGEHMEMRKRSISMASENRTNTVEDIIALPEGQRVPRRAGLGDRDCVALQQEA